MMKTVQTMFWFTLPILAVAIWAWVSNGFWMFLILYGAIWFLGFCIAMGIKVMELEP